MPSGPACAESHKYHWILQWIVTDFLTLRVKQDRAPKGHF